MYYRIYSYISDALRKVWKFASFPTFASLNARNFLLLTEIQNLLLIAANYTNRQFPTFASFPSLDGTVFARFRQSKKA